MPQTALPLPAGPVGLGKPVTGHVGSDDDGSSIDSDPAALVEDALLGELFFAQSEACQVTLRRIQHLQLIHVDNNILE